MSAPKLFTQQDLGPRSASLDGRYTHTDATEEEILSQPCVVAAIAKARAEALTVARGVLEASEAILFSGYLTEPPGSGDPLRTRARAANVAYLRLMPNRDPL